MNHRLDISDIKVLSWYSINSGGSKIFRGGGANPQGRRQDMILLNFPKKLHEIEKNLVARGRGRARGAPSPRRSATY